MYMHTQECVIVYIHDSCPVCTIREQIRSKGERKGKAGNPSILNKSVFIPYLCPCVGEKEITAYLLKVSEMY